MPAGNEETAAGMDWTPLFATQKKGTIKDLLMSNLELTCKLSPSHSVKEKMLNSGSL